MLGLPIGDTGVLCACLTPRAGPMLLVVVMALGNGLLPSRCMSAVSLVAAERALALDAFQDAAPVELTADSDRRGNLSDASSSGCSINGGVVPRLGERPRDGAADITSSSDSDITKRSIDSGTEPDSDCRS